MTNPPPTPPDEPVSKKSWIPKVLIVSVLAGAIGLVFHYDLHTTYLTLDALKESRASLQGSYSEHTALFIIGFIAIYVLVTALSIPGATIMTLAAGAIFGRWVGTGVVSIASTTGATLACVIARYLLRESIQSKFGAKLVAINEGIEREGAFYLFTLRLVPAFPFFIINLLMGLTGIRLVTFFFVSMVGMLPATFIYVNAGTELSQIDSLKGILSPTLILAFVLLGILPLIMKWVLARLRTTAPPPASDA